MNITLEPGGAFPPSPLVAANIRTSLKAAMVTVGSTAPTLQPGTSITAWFNTNTGDVNLYSGIDSINFTFRHCIVSSTAPTSPVTGTRWFNTTDSQSYTRVGNAWVQADIGPQGPPGAISTLSVAGVSTGDPGSAASVTIGGTAPNQTLTFTIPRGATGQSGLAGDKYKTTSSTNLLIPAIGTTITLTVGTGLSYSTNQTVLISNEISRHIHAEITSYDPADGVMIAVVKDTKGSGTYNSWTVNLSGTVGTFTGSLAGDVTGTQGATSIAAATVTGKALTGYSSAAGTITATDTILTAINKLNGNDGLKANLASPSFTGTVTLPAGTASVAPLKLTTGTNLSTAVFGSVEFDGTNLYLTNNSGSPTRKTIAFTDSNVTGSAASFTGSLAGDVTGTQGATSIAAATVTGKALTGYSSASGTITAQDTILSAINKLNGNVDAKAPNYGVVTNAFGSGYGSGVVTINWAAGSHWIGSLGFVGGNTIVFSNVVAGKQITLEITGEGQYLAWPNTIMWVAGTAPWATSSGATFATASGTRIIRLIATSTNTFIGMVETNLIAEPNTGKTIYVDSVVGTDQRLDGIGVNSKYNQLRPFQTIATAVNDSATGDLIYVRAGKYTVSDTIALAGNGGLHFEAGAEVTFTDAGEYLFTLTANESKSITGYAVFILGSGTAGFFQTGGGTNTVQLVNIECGAIQAHATVVNVFDLYTGVVVLKATTIQALGAKVAIVQGTSTNFNYDVKFTYCSQLLDMPVSNSNSQFSGVVWTVICYGAYGLRIVGGTTSLELKTLGMHGAGTPVAFEFANNDSNLNSHLFHSGRIMSGSNAPCISFTTSTATQKFVKLKGDVQLLTGGPACITAGSARQVAVSSAHSNVAVGANVTVVGLLTVNAAFTY